jgi:pimeloyl-ACP methyl ester carboxylesterase
MDSYTNPMKPWPGLEPFVRQVELPGNGLHVHAYVAGPQEAKALVLVHGLGDEADTWRHVIPPLARTHRVVALDLPGFGRSDKPDRAYSLPLLQGSLIELMDALGIDRATLVGNSLGALISHLAALEAPSRVDSLVLVDGGLMPVRQIINAAMTLLLLPRVGEWFYTRLRKDPQAAYDSLQPNYADLNALPAEDRDFLFQRVNERVWSDGQRRAFFSVLRSARSWLGQNQRELLLRLERLDLPTLVVWGEEDRVIPLRSGRSLLDRQPAARLITIPGAGHLPHQERPTAFLEAIRAAPHLVQG